MNFRPEELDRMAAVLQAPTTSFAELVGIAGLDPAGDLVGADLRRVNFRSDDLAGFNFARADICGANFAQARGLDPAMFVGAVWDGSTQWPAGFQPGERGPDVSWADAWGMDKYAVSCSSRHQKTVRLRKNAVYHLLRWLSEGERGWPRCM